MYNYTSNDNDNNDNGERREIVDKIMDNKPEPRFLVTLDCLHEHVMDAKTVARPVKVSPIDGTSYFLCRDCYTRKDESCSINPVHRAMNIKLIPDDLHF